MNRRRIVPAILILATVALGVVSFLRLQANAPHRFYRMPGQMYPLDRPANIALKYAAEGVVRSQLSALKLRDMAHARSYESHIVMQAITSPGQFQQYATGDIPELGYYDKIKFGNVMTDGENQRVLVPATIIGADKITVRASFMLIRDDDGVYRIWGVRGGRRWGASMPFPGQNN